MENPKVNSQPTQTLSSFYTRYSQHSDQLNTDSDHISHPNDCKSPDFESEAHLLGLYAKYGDGSVEKLQKIREFANQASSLGISLKLDDSISSSEKETPLFNLDSSDANLALLAGKEGSISDLDNNSAVAAGNGVVAEKANLSGGESRSAMEGDGEGNSGNRPIQIQAESPADVRGTWAARLGNDKVGQRKLRYIPPTISNGHPIIHVKSSQFEQMQKKHDNLVIGSFVGTRAEFGFVKKIVNSTWKPIKGFTMRVYGRQSYSFEFDCEEDKLRAIEIGNFHIASQVFLVRKWKPFVEAELDNLMTVPIWVRLIDHPMEMWDDEGFSQVASAVGEPLYADKLTELKRRTEYARICVEINVDSTCPKIIPVVIDERKRVTVKVEYNWRPAKCMKCRVFGHGDKGCPKTKNMQGDNGTIWMQKQAAKEFGGNASAPHLTPAVDEPPPPKTSSPNPTTSLQPTTASITRPRSISAPKQRTCPPQTPTIHPTKPAPPQPLTNLITPVRAPQRSAPLSEDKIDSTLTHKAQQLPGRNITTPNSSELNSLADAWPTLGRSTNSTTATLSAPTSLSSLLPTLSDAGRQNCRLVDKNNSAHSADHIGQTSSETNDGGWQTPSKKHTFNPLKHTTSVPPPKPFKGLIPGACIINPYEHKPGENLSFEEDLARSRKCIAWEEEMKKSLARKETPNKNKQSEPTKAIMSPRRSMRVGASPG